MQYDKKFSSLANKFVEKREYEMKHFKMLEELDRIKEKASDDAQTASEKFTQLFSKIERMVDEYVTSHRLNLILDRYAPLKMVEKMDERLELFVTK